MRGLRLRLRGACRAAAADYRLRLSQRGRTVLSHPGLLCTPHEPCPRKSGVAGRCSATPHCNRSSPGGKCFPSGTDLERRKTPRQFDCLKAPGVAAKAVRQPGRARSARPSFCRRGSRCRIPNSFRCTRWHSLTSPANCTARCGRCTRRPTHRPAHRQQGRRVEAASPGPMKKVSSVSRRREAVERRNPDRRESDETLFSEALSEQAPNTP